MRNDPEMENMEDPQIEAVKPESKGARRMRALASFVLGLIVAVVFHYTLYRMSLPQTPFIYQNF